MRVLSLVYVIKTKDVFGLVFNFVTFKVAPTKDLRKNVHEKYEKKTEKKLIPFGDGPFCEFKISTDYNKSGLYLYYSNGVLKYVGITVRPLYSRINEYGRISPINCWTGGRHTNVKINHKIFKEIEKGCNVELFFCEKDLPKTELELIEKRIINEYNPPWNATGTS